MSADGVRAEAAGAAARATAIAIAVDLAALAALRAIVDAVVIARGFSHVSDDDFARVTIAEAFAHAPRIDPTGTSWLPLPFWVNGAAMMVLGRSLGVARAVAIALGVASIVPPYAAMRALGVGRGRRLLAVALMTGVPWNAWLGIATVPESWSGALVGAAAIAIGVPRARPWAAAGLVAAALSRYEAWPACAAMAVVALAAAARGTSRRDDPAAGAGARGGAMAQLAAAGMAAFAPIAWMAWNAHAHGSATHFVARVAAYRQAIGAASAPLAVKLLGYPAALVTGARDVAVVAAVGAVCASGVLGDGDGAARVRRRWRAPLVTTAWLIAFLVWGDVRDGAPTHHAERALLGPWWVLGAFGVDAIATRVASFVAGDAARARRATVGVLAIAIATTWAAILPWRWSRCPGLAADESRAAQIARGEALRANPPASLEITPCAYEHYALLAAFGAPERAIVHEADRTHLAPVTAGCPRVDVK